MRMWLRDCQSAKPCFDSTRLRGAILPMPKGAGMKREIIIKETHRGLWYRDGVLERILEAGRYEIPSDYSVFGKKPKVDVVLVDVRERELTIKGQEILTADKVALRVSIIV